MPVSDVTFLGNSLIRWAQSLGTALGILAVLWLARRVLSVRLGALAARTTNSWDDLFVLLVQRTHGATLAVVALWPALGVVEMPASAIEVARVLTVVVGGLQLAIWGNQVIAHVLDARVAQLRQADPASATTLNGMTILARGVLWVVLVLLALDNLGVNISALVAGLGIGGVAVALALQNILGDLFASLSIVLDKPFVVGDFIVVGDLMGTVERVGLKTTRVRSLSGEQLAFANADLLGSRIRNFKRMAERRVLFTVGVTYQTSAEMLARISSVLQEVVSAEPGVRFDRAHLRSFDDSAITFEVVYYVLDPDYNRFMDVQQQINLAIYRRFEADGVEFAYPTRTVYIHPMETGAPGPGVGQRAGV
jgi:small-conductance mechanosensitive channel